MYPRNSRKTKLYFLLTKYTKQFPTKINIGMIN